VSVKGKTIQVSRDTAGWKRQFIASVNRVAAIGDVFAFEMMSRVMNVVGAPIVIIRGSSRINVKN